jgi:adenosylcobinamide-GDP ribazoletransferase
LKNLCAAIRFITVLPLGRSDQFDAMGMAPWFPVVGLLLGAALAGFDQAVGRQWGVQTAAVMDVIFMAALTGAFHLDGLADTADGLFSHRGREDALEIMKDSRTGAMGVVALCAVLALKWAGLSGISVHRGLLLVLVPAYARMAILCAMHWLPYGRPAGGTGLPFFTRKLTWRQFWALPLPLLLSAGLGPLAFGLNAGFVLLVALILIYYKKRIGAVTGDMLGALTETVEAGLFLIVSMGAGR